MRNCRILPGPRFRIFLLVTATTFLAGCSMNEVRDEVATDLHDVSGIMTEQKRTQEERIAASRERTTPDIEFIDRPWVSTHSVPRETRLPPLFRERAEINEPFGSTLSNILSQLSTMIGTPILVERDVIDPVGSTGTSRVRPGEGIFQIESDAELIGSNRLPVVNLALQHRGTVASSLDAITRAIQANWRYNADRNEIVVYRYLTRSMRVASLPGSMQIQAGVSANIGTAAASQFQAGFSVWDGLLTDIQSMLTESGRVSVSESTGMIIVRDTPESVDRIEEYVQRSNDVFRKQVTVDVQVYFLRSNKSDIRGVNWQALFQSRNLDATFSTVRGDLTGLNSFVMGIPDTVDPTTSLSLFEGSGFILDSLSSVADVVDIQTGTIKTQNNQPSSYTANQRRAFIESVETSIEGGVRSFTPVSGEVQSGMSIQVLPHIQDRGNLLMQVKLSLSSLDFMDREDIGDTFIQLPQTSVRESMGRFWLRSGQSLVMTGFENSRGDLRRSGPVDQRAWALGGRRDIARTEEAIVVVLTPVISEI